MTAVHPDDELLAAYLEHDLDVDEEIELETHLRECDLCVSSVTLMQPHLAAASTIAVRLPAALRTEAVARRPSPTAAVRSSGPARRPPFLLRWPVLIPSSLAAGFLLAFSLSTVSRQQPALMTRAVEPVVRTSVTVEETGLRRTPDDSADVVASLEKGERVTVIERRADWLRIESSGGSQGWVRAERLR